MTALRRTPPAHKAHTSEFIQQTTAFDARPAWVHHLMALGLLLFILCVTFPDIALRHEVFIAGDFDAPSQFGVVGERSLAAGEYPQWNPYLFLGMPSFGSLIYVGYVFPISVLLTWAAKLPGFPPQGWMIFYFLSAGFGAYLLVRSLGGFFWAALLAGATFMLTPHLVSMGVFGHGSKLASVAFLPYLLWAQWHLLRGTNYRLWTAVLALLLALQLLRGHPQIAYYGLLMMGIVWLTESIFMWRDSQSRGRCLRASFSFWASVVMGMLAAAVLLWPIHSYAPYSIRGATAAGGAEYGFATNWSLSPSEMSTFILPSAMGFGEGTYVGKMPFTNFPNYLGLTVVLFGITGLLLLRGRFFYSLLAVMGLSLMLSFGKHVPVFYDLFYEFSPFFNKFRAPVMILVLLQFGFSVAAGLGFSALAGRLPAGFHWRRPFSASVRRKWLQGTVGLAVLLLLIGWLGADGLSARVLQSSRLPEEVRGLYANTAQKLLQDDAVRLCVLGLMVGFAVLSMWRRKLPGYVVGLLILALAVFDLHSVNKKMLHPEKIWLGVPPRIAQESAQREVKPVHRYLEQLSQTSVEPPRILPLQNLYNSNEWMVYGVSSVGGYHAAKLSRYQQLTDSKALYNPKVMDMLGVQYLLSAQGLRTSAKVAYSDAQSFVYENPGALPRARITGLYHVIPAEDCMQALVSGKFDLRKEVFLEVQPTGEIHSDASGTAEFKEFSCNRIVIETHASNSGLLVVSEAYHPNWQVTVNGAPETLLVANGLLRAVRVPAGPSEVVMEFHDQALRAGLWVSMTSLLLLLSLLGIGIQGARRENEVGRAIDASK